MTRPSVAEPISSVSVALTGELKTVVVDRGMHLPSVIAEAGLSGRMARDLSRDRHEWTIAELSRVAGVLHPDDAAEEFARLTSVAASA